MNVCLYRPFTFIIKLFRGCWWSSRNVFKNLKLVKLVFAVLTSHLLLEEILKFRVVHSKFQIKCEIRGFPGAERILQL